MADELRERIRGGLSGDVREASVHDHDSIVGGRSEGGAAIGGGNGVEFRDACVRISISKEVVIHGSGKSVALNDKA